MISVIGNEREFDRKAGTKIEAIEANNEDNFANEGGVSSIAVKSERSEEDKVRVSLETDIKSNMESRVFELRKNEIRNGDGFEAQNDVFGSRNDSFEDEADQTVDSVVRVDRHVELYKSLLSEFDDFVANEKMNAGTSRALSYGFEVGDMVWGKVKSHPWWPGHIFNESFASNPVRHSRRDGHVLVAFFGDSSYGWFDPAELIPFDPHFVEKSQQTNSRNFVKAVEEAMDEACRRRGLGLACKCRNPYNFRSTNVQGYFVVDVPDFEPGGIYSATQIKKARDKFTPIETLSFVRQLASAPQGSEQKSIDFIQNKATLLAFRKAVFEEFDETYAQAFGVQPSRPAHERAALELSAKQPPRAPLSGPLVIAETLGGGRSSKKSMKVKDHQRKDRYLFKRRDEPGDSRTFQTSEAQAGSLAPAVVMEGSSALATGDYVLQKRASAPHTATKFEQTGFISGDSTSSSGTIHGKETVMVSQAHPSDDTCAIEAASLDSKTSQELQELKEGMGSGVVSSSVSSGSFDKLGKRVFSGPVDGKLQPSQLEAEVRVDVENESARFQQSELSSSAREEGGHSLDQIQDSEMGVHPSPIDSKRSAGVSLDGKMKKPKVPKQHLGEMSSENAFVGEPKKKKKKRREFGMETNSDHQQKRFAQGKGEIGVGKLSKKSAQVGLASREDFAPNHQKNNVGASTSVLNSVGTLPGVSITEVGLPHLLSDLHALALNPFHGLERNSPATIRQCFLRFRSLVYQKSLVLSSPSETEPTEARSGKSSSSVGVPGENDRDLPASKPVKHLSRPDDPTKAGRKRLPSERQEENAAKRLKKISNVKSLTTEKKGQRILDGQRVEGKEHTSVLPLKPVKPDFVKKSDPPARAVDPTMLVMKFPPGTSLPSAAELKARFGRFGSIDQSGTRVFWKSSSCRVVFRYKVDAQAAFKYANGNNALFGNVKVRYSLRDFEASSAEVADSDKVRGDDAANEIPRSKDPMVERSTPAFASPQQPTIQLKSCLKKPTGDEAGQVTNGSGSRGTARVKFMLGGEENSRGEQLMVGNRNNFNSNTSFADGGAPSSVAMDFSSKNFQKVIPPFSSTMHSHSQFSKPLFNNSHHSEVPVPPRNSHLNAPSIPPSAPSIDISQQMLSLLTRCNDVVTNITGLLGYVPYHPI